MIFLNLWVPIITGIYCISEIQSCTVEKRASYPLSKLGWLSKIWLNLKLQNLQSIFFSNTTHCQLYRDKNDSRLFSKIRPLSQTVFIWSSLIFSPAKDKFQGDVHYRNPIQAKKFSTIFDSTCKKLKYSGFNVNIDYPPCQKRQVPKLTCSDKFLFYGITEGRYNSQYFITESTGHKYMKLYNSKTNLAVEKGSFQLSWHFWRHLPRHLVTAKWKKEPQRMWSSVQVLVSNSSTPLFSRNSASSSMSFSDSNRKPRMGKKNDSTYRFSGANIDERFGLIGEGLEFMRVCSSSRHNSICTFFA